MKTYYFTTRVYCTVAVEAATEDEALEKIEEIDPLSGQVEKDYEEWELDEITE